MPLIHRAFINGQPMISVIIGISEPRQTAMTAGGIAIPPAVTLNLLIDTGASCVVLDQDAIASLNLVPTGVATMHTPSTGAVPHLCNQYDVSLVIPSPKGVPFEIGALPILESTFRAQGFDGLLGRDVLQQCVLFYNSPLGGYTLAY
jgi:hypothetical protein